MELGYGAFNLMKELFDYETIIEMPQKELNEWIKFMSKKMTDIAKERQNQELEKELTGKSNIPKRRRE